MEKYIIFNSEEAEELDLSLIEEKSTYFLRKSLDGSKTFARYKGEKPEAFSDKQELTLEEFREILKGPEWTSEEDF